MTHQTRSIILTAAGCLAVDGHHILGCITCGARAVVPDEATDEGPS